MSTAIVPEESPTSGSLPGAPEAPQEREPRGYTAKYSLAMYGLMLVIMTPALGGLAVRLQNINNGDLKAATSQLAVVTGIGALFALVTQPLAGRLSDRTAGRSGMRRPWIIVGVVGAALSVLGLGFAPNMVTVLVLWCCAQFFSNCAQATETATVPDQVPPRRRGAISGIAGACSPLAILSGSAILALVSADTVRFAIPGVIGVVFGLWFAFTLKDRVLKPSEREAFSVKEFFGSFIFNPRKYPDLGWAWLSKFLVMFGYATVGTYLVLFLASKYGMDTAEQTKFNLYANLVSVTFMVVLSILGGRMSDRIGRRRVFVAWSGIILAAGIVVMAISPVLGHSAGLAAILVGEGLMGAGSGLFFAVDMALCTEVLPSEKDTAKDLGVLNIANTLPQSVAPFLAGPIILAVGGAGYTVWFCIGAVIAVLGGVSVLKVKAVK